MLRDERPSGQEAPATLSQTCMAPRLRMKPHIMILTPGTGDHKDTEGVPARGFPRPAPQTSAPVADLSCMHAAADALTSAASDGAQLL